MILTRGAKHTILNWTWFCSPKTCFLSLCYYHISHFNDDESNHSVSWEEKNTHLTPECMQKWAADSIYVKIYCTHIEITQCPIHALTQMERRESVRQKNTFTDLMEWGLFDKWFFVSLYYSTVCWFKCHSTEMLFKTIFHSLKSFTLKDFGLCNENNSARRRLILKETLNQILWIKWQNSCSASSWFISWTHLFHYLIFFLSLQIGNVPKTSWSNSDFRPIVWITEQRTHFKTFSFVWRMHFDIKWNSLKPVKQI